MGITRIVLEDLDSAEIIKAECRDRALKETEDTSLKRPWKETEGVTGQKEGSLGRE